MLKLVVDGGCADVLEGPAVGSSDYLVQPSVHLQVVVSI